MIDLKKKTGNQRLCKLVASPSLPEQDAVFQLGNEGVCNSAANA